MLTKAKAKLILSLKDKKYRQQLGFFVAEGTKIVAELLASKITVNSLYATSNWLDNHRAQFSDQVERVEINETQLKQLSYLQTPNQVLAVCKIPKQPFDIKDLEGVKTLMLDTMQDPGNLGTIIRIADWYGIPTIICSPDSVDVYNPKVIQATMGSFLRVRVLYTELQPILQQYKGNIMGAVMQGNNLHFQLMPQSGLLIIGNEGSGISAELLAFVQTPITIPKFGQAESLNAGAATAIICDGWLRNS